jgi:hypothetical protein
MQLQRIYTLAFGLFFLVSVSACSGDSTGDPLSGTGGMLGTGGTAGMGGVSGVGGASGFGGTGAVGGAVGGCFEARCPDGKLYECGDCMDNDEIPDGLIDDKDPECLGPCDNTEGPVLTTGTPGTTGNQCQADCYFDGGNGCGRDDCCWDYSCYEDSPVRQCPYTTPTLAICAEPQPVTCLPLCGPLTPNGCDCFGCCTLDEGKSYVYLGSEDANNNGTCTFADLANPELCRSCTPVEDCLNTCERCEICLNKPTIPEDCFPGSGGSGGMGSGGAGGDGGDRCAPDTQPCGLEGDDPCVGFCLTGCCLVVQ